MKKLIFIPIVSSFISISFSSEIMKSSIVLEKSTKSFDYVIEQTFDNNLLIEQSSFHVLKKSGKKNLIESIDYKNSLPVSIEHYSIDKKLHGKQSYFYNSFNIVSLFDNGHLIENKTFNKDNILTSQKKFFKDKSILIVFKDSVKVKELAFDLDNKILYSISFSSDGKEEFSTKSGLVDSDLSISPLFDKATSIRKLSKSFDLCKKKLNILDSETISSLEKKFNFSYSSDSSFDDEFLINHQNILDSCKLISNSSITIPYSTFSIFKKFKNNSLVVESKSDLDDKIMYYINFVNNKEEFSTNLKNKSPLFDQETKKRKTKKDFIYFLSRVKNMDKKIVESLSLDKVDSFDSFYKNRSFYLKQINSKI
jgi:hypothetical protein